MSIGRARKGGRTGKEGGWERREDGEGCVTLKASEHRLWLLPPSFRYKCTFYHSSKKLLFETDGDFYQVPQLVKYREYVTVMCPAPNDTSTVQILHIKIREHHERESEKNARARGTRLLLLVSEFYDGETMPKKSPRCGSLRKSAQRETSWQANLDAERGRIFFPPELDPWEVI